jgi:hypothetical protein
MKDLFSEINTLPCRTMTKELEAPPDYLKHYRVRFFPLGYLVEITRWADGRYVISHFTKDDIHEIDEFKCKFENGAIKPILTHLNKCLGTNYTDVEYLK